MVKLSLIKSVARGIRYSPFPQLKGDAVKVSSLGAAEIEVQNFMSQKLSAEIAPRFHEGRFE